MRFLVLPLSMMFLLSCGIQDSEHSQRIDLSKSGVQEQINLNEGWHYLEQNVAYEDLGGIPEDDWQSIDLPHTWNHQDATDDLPGYRRSSSWYRKYITLPKYDGAIHLYFEGVNIVTRILVNGQKVGGHVGGYLGFEVDISDYAQPGRPNEILVWVDNSVNPDIIPEQNLDFIIYGGVTRDVWLKFYPEVSLRTVHISTLEVSEAKASTKVQVQVNSKLERDTMVKVVASLVDPAGSKRSSSSIKATVKPGVSLLPIKLADLENPLLWSPQSPHLYTIHVSLRLGEISDEISQRFGYRWFEFEESGHLQLNGEPISIIGARRNEAGARADGYHRRDIELIKKNGANGILLSNHPHDPAIYRACDELGLLIWDDFPWFGEGVGSAYWEENVEGLLKQQISQKYNHPSILVWSFGDEYIEQSQVTGEGKNNSRERLISRLLAITHDYDPYRSLNVSKYGDRLKISQVYRHDLGQDLQSASTQR